jgi:YVTN family beta-propeller protein
VYGQWLETTIPVAGGAYALVWNSQNNKIYCAIYVMDNVKVIDGQTNAVITTIPVESWPNGFCWNSLQNRVYVANYSSSSVSVIRDITGIEERSTLDATGNMLEVYPNPAKVFFTLRLPQSADGEQIKIFDVTGKIVISEELKGKNNRISLDRIKNGVYFVKVGNEMVKEKLVVTK